MTAKMSLVIWIGVVMLTLAIPIQAQTDDQGWISLFDGSFNGWKAAEKENAGTFTIKDGASSRMGRGTICSTLGRCTTATFGTSS